MLHKYSVKNATFKFLNRAKEARKNRNVFTIIVGKNGTGKSRLLRNIALDFLHSKGPSVFKKLADVSQHEIDTTNNLARTNDLPTRLICVSTSPFDKFPLVKRTATIADYSYLGLRGLTSVNMGFAYISRIIFTLIEAASQSANHSSAISYVLDYLDYVPVMQIKFTPISQVQLRLIVTSSDPRTEIEQFLKKRLIANQENLVLMHRLVSADERVFQQVMSAANRLAELPKRHGMQMKLTSSGVTMSGDDLLPPKDVALLGKYGLLRLDDVELKKKTADLPLKISEMSSGEQAVIMGLLGIGSQIEDGALVCIDEPELCLHPEWQERYIQLLSSIFSHHKKCHFIIATHSPQIVAQLPNEGCYVMQMENGELHSANEFAKRSIDFQLATVFNAPGYKNEYLSRLALNIFIEVAKNKEFSSENQANFLFLNASIPNLSKDDPLIEIINSIQQMYNTYG